VYTYKSISDDPTCQAGTAISWALDLFEKPGAAKMAPAERTTAFDKVPLSLYTHSEKYPIASYTRLFAWKSDTPAQTKIISVKKALSEDKPVVIGLNCPDSFQYAKGVWQPTEDPSKQYGGHALCVIGYDDTKYGGAFNIQNSWGTEWGNNGYIWMRYKDFAAFVMEAYEMVEKMGSGRNAAEYAGRAGVVFYHSKAAMPVRFNSQGYYQTTDAYSAGTRFHFLIGNDTPAFVYAFASDDTHPDKTSLIFPQKGVSAALDYGTNTIAFPAEKQWIMLDNQAGTDYLVILYSKKPLNLDAIRSAYAGAKGEFPARVLAAVGADYIPPSDGKYEVSSISFSAKSLNPDAVFGLLLAIRHSRSQ
jgi:hypothetical protein